MELLHDLAPRRLRWFWIAFIAVLVLAIALRVYDIGLRPMHNDEGVNYHFVQETLSRGYFPYSHENYHGPSYFYLTTACIKLIGSDELGVRFSAILAGVLLIIILLSLRRDLGDSFVLIAGLLLALSSSNLFYSRYAIHEALFALGGTWFALASYFWWLRKSPAAIYSGMLAVALLIATKETFIVTLATVFAGFLALGGYREAWQALRKQGAPLFYGALALIVVITALFTGGFQWPGGVREMLLAVPQWIGRNRSDVGHFKPFIYYLKMIFDAEPQVLLAAGFPLLIGLILPRRAIALIASRDGAFIRFVTVWGVAALLTYSLISYKTPWLVISATVPLTLAVAWWLDRMIVVPIRRDPIGVIALVVVVAVAWFSSVRFNFQIPVGKYNPYSYVHTSPGMIEFVRQTERYWERTPEARVLIAVGGYWPLPYYFRHRSGQLAYVTAKKPQDYSAQYDVMVFNRDVIWNEPGWARVYYRLSDVQEVQAYFKRKG